MTFLTDAPLRFGVWLTSTVPSPSPTGYGEYTGDADTVTPGWIGFAITFLVALATVFIAVDMVRRVRRTRYRGEIREKLQAEAEATGRTGADATGTPAGEGTPPRAE